MKQILAIILMACFMAGLFFFFGWLGLFLAICGSGAVLLLLIIFSGKNWWK